MILRITIEIGEKEFSDKGEKLNADIRERIEIDPFTYGSVDGYESEAIEAVRDVLIKIRKSMPENDLI